MQKQKPVQQQSPKELQQLQQNRFSFSDYIVQSPKKIDQSCNQKPLSGCQDVTNTAIIPVKKKPIDNLKQQYMSQVQKQVSPKQIQERTPTRDRIVSNIIISSSSSSSSQPKVEEDSNQNSTILIGQNMTKSPESVPNKEHGMNDFQTIKENYDQYIIDLKVKLNSLINENERNVNNNGYLMKELNQLRSKYDCSYKAYQGTIETLKQQLQEAQKNISNNNQSPTHSPGVGQELFNTNKQKQENELLMQENDTLKSVIQEQLVNIQDLQRANEDQQSNFRQLAHKLSLLENSINDLQEQNTQLQAQLLNETQENSLLKEELNKKKLTINVEQKETGELQKQSEQMLLMKQLEEQKTNIQQLMSELQQSTITNEKLNKQVIVLKNARRQQNREVPLPVADNQANQSKIIDKTIILQSQQQLQEQVDKFILILQEKELKINELHLNYQQSMSKQEILIKEQQDEITLQKNRNDELEQQLTIYNKKIQEDLIGSQKQIQYFQKSIQSLQIQQENDAKVLITNEAQIKQLREQLHAAHLQSQQQNVQCTTLKMELEAIHKANTELTQMQQLAEDKIKSLETQVQEDQKVIKIADQKAIEQQSVIQARCRDIDLLKEQVSELGLFSENYAMISQQAREIQGQLEQREKELEQVKLQHFQKLQACLEEKDSALTEIRAACVKEMEELKQKNDQRNKQLEAQHQRALKEGESSHQRALKELDVTNQRILKEKELVTKNNYEQQLLLKSKELQEVQLNKAKEIQELQKLNQQELSQKSLELHQMQERYNKLIEVERKEQNDKISTVQQQLFQQQLIAQEMEGKAEVLLNLNDQLNKILEDRLQEITNLKKEVQYKDKSLSALSKTQKLKQEDIQHSNLPSEVSFGLGVLDHEEQKEKKNEQAQDQHQQLTEAGLQQANLEVLAEQARSEELQKKCVNLQRALEQQKTTFHQQLQNEQDLSRQREQEATVQSLKWKEQHSQMNDQVTQLKEQVQQLKDEATQLNNQISQLKEHSSQLKEQNSLMKDQISQQKDQFSQLKDQVSQLKEQVTQKSQQAQQQSQECKRFQEQNEQLQLERSASQEEYQQCLQQVKQQQDRLRTIEQDSQNLIAENEKLSNLLSQEKGNQEVMMKSHHEKILELTKNLEILKGKVLEDQLKDKELLELQMKNTNLQSELVQLKESLPRLADQVKDQKKSLKAELKETRQKYKDLSASYQELQATYTALQSKTQSTLLEQEKLNGQILSVQKLLQPLEAENKNLQEALSRSGYQRSQLQQEMQAAITEQSRMQSMLTSKIKELEMSADALARQREELTGLEQALRQERCTHQSDIDQVQQQYIEQSNQEQERLANSYRIVIKQNEIEIQQLRVKMDGMFRNSEQQQQQIRKLEDIIRGQNKKFVEAVSSEQWKINNKENIIGDLTCQINSVNAENNHLRKIVHNQSQSPIRQQSPQPVSKGIPCPPNILQRSPRLLIQSPSKKIAIKEEACNILSENNYLNQCVLDKCKGIINSNQFITEI